MKKKKEKVQLNPEKWVDLYGDDMFRHAFFRCSSKEVAEDIVQETFISALKSAPSFKGLSSEKTWLFSILQHKIVDYFRKSKKEYPISNILDDKDESIERFFDQRGHWKKGERPKKWKVDPKFIHEKDEFWKTFEQCVLGLPQHLKEVFSLRELEQFASEKVCKILDITTTNLWTKLHRARFKIRYCLEVNWFTSSKEKK